MISTAFNKDVSKEVCGEKYQLSISTQMCSENSCGTATCSSCGQGC